MVACMQSIEVESWAYGILISSVITFHIYQLFRLKSIVRWWGDGHSAGGNGILECLQIYCQTQKSSHEYMNQNVMCKKVYSIYQFIPQVENLWL